MGVFLVSLLVFALAFTAMAVGYLVRGKCLKGTCGGLNQLRDKDGVPYCEMCAPEKVAQSGISSPKSPRP